LPANLARLPGVTRFRDSGTQGLIQGVTSCGADRHNGPRAHADTISVAQPHSRSDGYLAVVDQHAVCGPRIEDHPGAIRPVVSDALWGPLAASTGTRNHPNEHARLSQQRGVARLTGLHAGSWYDSARMALYVSTCGTVLTRSG
jgi:hypothetical protein